MICKCKKHPGEVAALFVVSALEGLPVPGSRKHHRSLAGFRVKVNFPK